MTDHEQLKEIWEHKRWDRWPRAKVLIKRIILANEPLSKSRKDDSHERFMACIRQLEKEERDKRLAHDMEQLKMLEKHREGV